MNLRTKKFSQSVYQKSEICLLYAERFLSSIVNEYGEHSISTDGGTWYPQACQFLKLGHHIHSFVYKDEKSIIERTMQYIKDRIKNFDDYFPAEKRNVN